MSKQPSIVGASLIAAAMLTFGFAPAAQAAGNQNNGSGSGYSGGGGGYNGGANNGGGRESGGHFGGYAGSGFSGHTGFSGGHSGFSSGTVSRHYGSGFSSSTRESFGGRPGVSTSIAPGGSHFSPNGSIIPSMAHHVWSGGGSAWQQGLKNWKNGQNDGKNRNWRGYGNAYIYPYYVAFVPLLYGGYGYLSPYYYSYGDPYAFYALYDDVDAGLPPMPGVANFAPPIAGGGNAAPNGVQNGLLPNAAGLNGAAVNGAAVAAVNFAAQNPPVPNAPAPNGAGAAAVADADDAGGSAGAEFFAQAQSAFQEGHYHDAQRLATHAAVESPKNPKAHELMSLSMFAAGDYRGAAIEAHAAIALGPVADWATVFGYYGEQARYTAQLRSLEKYSRENPKSAEARFLRAYHYLMTGHVDAAKEQLAEAVKLTPNDKMAAGLLKKYSANGAANAPPVPAPPAAVPGAQKVPPAKPSDPDGFDS